MSNVRRLTAESARALADRLNTEMARDGGEYSYAPSEECGRHSVLVMNQYGILVDTIKSEVIEMSKRDKIIAALRRFGGAMMDTPHTETKSSVLEEKRAVRAVFRAIGEPLPTEEEFKQIWPW